MAITGFDVALILFYFFFGIKLIGSLLHTKKYFRCTPLSLKKKKKSFKKKLTKKFELSRHTTRRVSLSKNIKTIPICCFLLFYAHHLDYNFHFFKFFLGFNQFIACRALYFAPPPPHSVLLLLPLLLPGWSVNTPTVSPSFGQRCSCSVIGMRLPLISRRIFISRN